MARPAQPAELVWLRHRGIQVVLSLTEGPLPRAWVNDAGLMAVHVPIVDMGAPSPEQFDECLRVIRRASESKFGVAVHCQAGLGRTGTILAAWYVEQGLDAAMAIAKVREMRPGSIESREQEEAIATFASQDLHRNSDAPK